MIAEALDNPALEEVAALALLMMGDRRGIDFHARALTENRRGLTGSPGEIVGRYGGPSHLLLLGIPPLAELMRAHWAPYSVLDSSVIPELYPYC